MKRTIMTMSAIILATTGFFAFSSLEDGAIKGTVSPADKATEVWAIQGTDTVKAPITDGAFNLTVKAGTHTVIIDAVDPYKDVVKEGVAVTEGQTTDLGETPLEQQ